MDKYAVNALKRARNSKGITQEKLAEMSGFSVDSIQAWEAGTRMPSVATLDLLASSLTAPWLTGMYLREQPGGEGLAELIPNFTPGEPPSRAAMALLNRISAFFCSKCDRQLMQITEDDIIADEEKPEYEKINRVLDEINQASAAMRYVKNRHIGQS